MSGKDPGPKAPEAVAEGGGHRPKEPAAAGGPPGDQLREALKEIKTEADAMVASLGRPLEAWVKIANIARAALSASQGEQE